MEGKSDPTIDWIGTVLEHGRVLKEPYEQLNVHERILYCVYCLDAEVYNGGFNQYFGNASGDQANEVAAAFEAVGSKKALDIVKRAVAMFPVQPIPTDPDARDDAYGDTDEERDLTANLWNDLDEEYWRSEENLYVLCDDYVRAHLEAFPLPPGAEPLKAGDD